MLLLISFNFIPAQTTPLIKDGDMVALVGGAMIEREQISGYWETELTRRMPGQKVRFRNLAWSGDTVFGHARAGFGSTPDGYKKMIEHINFVKPNVTLFAYGASESFDGETGLVAFQKGFEKLLKDLSGNKSKSVLISPLWHENLGAPLPDGSLQNQNLGTYSTTIAEVAKTSHASFYDLFRSRSSFDSLLGENTKLTSNGIHPTNLGYYLLSNEFSKAFAINEEAWEVAIDMAKGTINALGCEVKTEGKLNWVVNDKMLPRPVVTGAMNLNPAPRKLTIKNLPQGIFKLMIDGKEVANQGSEEWSKGVVLSKGPDFDQVEMLRKLINEKNRQYFHRWRPQNETYLLGFRKHEQGQNAQEIPKFDPIVAAKEEEIFKLNKPVARTYSLIEVK